MDTEKKTNYLRNIIYMLLFAILIFAFIFLSNKYGSNNRPTVRTIQDYYESVSSERFIPINGTKMKHVIKEEKSIIFIGNYTSPWSLRYLQELDSILKTLDISSIYYYDINNDKAQRNAVYYDIRSLLEGNLVTTDSGENNLLSPSFYIIDHGQVLYYNIDTVTVKNNLPLEVYWTEEREASFKTEIISNIQQYYLNN